MEYVFLVETYDTERLKTLSAWSMFRDDDLTVRPHPTDPRGRNALEQMIHQCMGENKWFIEMLGIDIKTPPLPQRETRLEFIRRYADDSEQRSQTLRKKDTGWWEEEITFFDVKRTRAWVMTRRLTHSAQHRGYLIALLKQLGRDVHSIYGPTANTGGLPINGAKTVYAYPDIASLVEGETSGGKKAPLPGPGDKPVTERP